MDRIVQQIDDEVAASRLKQAQAAVDPSGPPSPLGEVQGLAKEQVGDVRATVVQLIVFDEVARRYAASKGLSLPAQDYQAAAQQFGLSESNPYIKLAVDADGYRTLLLSKAQPVAPTEADLLEAYRKVVASGGQYRLLRGAEAAVAGGAGVGRGPRPAQRDAGRGGNVQRRGEPALPAVGDALGRGQRRAEPNRVGLPPAGRVVGIPAVRDLAP